MAETSDLSGEPTTNATLDTSAEQEQSWDRSDAQEPQVQMSAPLPAGSVHSTKLAPSYPESTPGRSLRSFKKSVERAISRATGELQAYTEALSTLVQERHIKVVEQEDDSGNDHLSPAAAESASSIATDAPAITPKAESEGGTNDASNALRRLVKESKDRRKSRVVNVESDVVTQLIEQAIIESAGKSVVTPPPEPASLPETVQPVNLPETVQPVSLPETVQPVSLPETAQPVSLPETIQPASQPEIVQPASQPQIVQPASQPETVQPASQPEIVQAAGLPETAILSEVDIEPSQALYESPAAVEPAPRDVDMQPATGAGSGFHNLMSRAGRAVKRSTGEVQIYAEAVSKLIHERAHPGPLSDVPATDVAPGGHLQPTPPAQPQESGLQGFVGRAIRRTTGEMAALRSQLSQLVDDARVKENQKSQERIQSMQTTDRLPIELPERLEAYKYASLCPSLWKDLAGGDQYRHCNQCGLFIYDFKDKSVAEIEKMVFQREGLSKPSFYQREDGRFLVRDCPVGLARRQRRMVAVAVIVVVVGGGLALGMLMPKPPPPPVISDGDARTAHQAKGKAGRAVRNASGTGYGNVGTPGTSSSETGSNSGGDQVSRPRQPGQAEFVLPQPKTSQGVSTGVNSGTGNGVNSGSGSGVSSGTNSGSEPPVVNEELEKSLRD